MFVVGGFMVPHPPLIIPEVGKGEENKITVTIQAYEQVGREIAALRPDTIVVLSPHNPMYSDYFHIRKGKRHAGNFSQFRAPQVRMEAVGDDAFVEELCRMGECEGFPWGTLGSKGKELDHGTMIPLYFVNKFYTDYELVSIGLSGMSLPLHYRLGQAIRRTAETLGRRIVVIASGDLSHYLKADGPYGYHEEGPQYDEKIMDVMGNARFGELFEFSDNFCSRAGECGHRAFVILAGVLDRTQVDVQRLSYEGVFGVGYGICIFHIKEENTERNFLAQYLAKREKEIQEHRKTEDAYVALARNALEHFILKGGYLKLPDELPSEMREKQAGVFVSIHQDGNLRGCIGTIGPVQEHIAKEIIVNAVSAGTADPRFAPVSDMELSGLTYSVDVLGEPEPVSSMQELDVKRYGVIVTKEKKRGLLLPDLEGVDTPEQQIAVAMQKAGIGSGEQDIRLERFQVIRHGDKS